MGSFLLFSFKAKRSEALSDGRGGPSGCMEGTGIPGEFARSARSPGPSGLKDCPAERVWGAHPQRGSAQCIRGVIPFQSRAGFLLGCKRKPLSQGFLRPIMVVCTSRESGSDGALIITVWKLPECKSFSKGNERFQGHVCRRILLT